MRSKTTLPPCWVAALRRGSVHPDVIDFAIFVDEAPEEQRADEPSRSRSSLFVRQEVLDVIDGYEQSGNGDIRKCVVFLLLATFVGISANDPIIKSASKVRVEENQHRIFLYSPASVVLMASVMSILLGNIVAFTKHRFQGVRRCWDLPTVTRMAPCSALFTVCNVLKFIALNYLPADMVMLLDQFSLVVMALMMKWVMGKTYSASQWTSLFLISLSMLQYMLLRQEEKTDEVVANPGELAPNLLVGLAIMMLQVLLSVLASLLAEKTLKEVDMHFWEQKACMEVSGSVVACLFCYVIGPRLYNDRAIVDNGLLANWDMMTCLCLTMMLAKLWLSGIIAKLLDSVVKQLSSSTALIVVYFESLLLGANHFDYTVFVALAVVASSIVSFVLSTRQQNQLLLVDSKVKKVRDWAHSGAAAGTIELQGLG